jgi:hypothetical protein
MSNCGTKTTSDAEQAEELKCIDKLRSMHMEESWRRSNARRATMSGMQQESAKAYLYRMMRDSY